MLIGLLVALLVGYAVLRVSQVAGASRGRVNRSLMLIESYGFADARPVEDEVAAASPITAVGDRLIRSVGTSTREEQRKLLLAAGMYDTTPGRFLGLRVFAAVGLPVLLAQFALSATSTGLGIVMILVSGATGWRLPMIVVARRGKDRLGQIDRQMPELVDLLIVSIESGLAFNAAIGTAADRIDGPLGAELRLVLQEQQLGASIQDGLHRFTERADTPATRLFARTISQAEKLGVSVGPMLRTLALEMRKRRRAQAETLAQQAPTKILFPLVFLIFPSIFVVLLTPAAIAMIEGFQ